MKEFVILDLRFAIGKCFKLSENVFMTEEKTILEQIQQLPEQLKQEVLHYAEFLREKYTAQNRKNKDRKAGSAKGKYKLAPDFDAPLEDFKEYM